MNELAHSKSCIEQVSKSCLQCVSDNGLHPVSAVTWSSCRTGKAITYFLTYIGVTNTFVPLRFATLGGTDILSGPWTKSLRVVLFYGEFDYVPEFCRLYTFSML